MSATHNLHTSLNPFFILLSSIPIFIVVSLSTPHTHFSLIPIKSVPSHHSLTFYTHSFNLFSARFYHFPRAWSPCKWSPPSHPFFLILIPAFSLYIITHAHLTHSSYTTYPPCSSLNPLLSLNFHIHIFSICLTHCNSSLHPNPHLHHHPNHLPPPSPPLTHLPLSSHSIHIGVLAIWAKIHP